MAVEADLRPRLAFDLAETLNGGAKEALVRAWAMTTEVLLGPDVVARSD